MSRARTLVTGASGFVGRRLVPLLTSSADVVAVRRHAARDNGPETTVITGMEAGWTSALPVCDVVIWLAQSRRYREFPDGAADMVAINVSAFFELLDWAARAGVRRVVYASSGSVYARADGLLTETAPTDATSMYAATKLSGELLLAQYAGAFEVVTARVFGVYGPGQTGMAVAAVVEAVLGRRAVVLTDGIGMTFTPIFVDDTAAIFAALSEIPLPGRSCIVNVAGSEVVTLADIATLTGQLSGTEPDIRAAAGVAQRLAADTSFLEALIPRATRRGLRAGLRAMVPGSHPQHERSK